MHLRDASSIYVTAHSSSEGWKWKIVAFFGFLTYTVTDDVNYTHHHDALNAGEHWLETLLDLPDANRQN